MFYEEKGLAMCGLACALCSQAACPGCLKEGCEGRANCKIYHCASAKGLPGCYACDQFPCEESMFQSVRVRAFNQYARAFGVPALMQRLKENAQNGIVYHQPDDLKGDYDAFSTEDAIMRFIQFGWNDPYMTCPVLESEHFRLRLVAEADAADLLGCYSDPEAQQFFNADNCTSNFKYTSLAEMTACIRDWLQLYQFRAFVRWSIVDKSSEHAVGTVEMFGSPEKWGILRVDANSRYENRALLKELFELAGKQFFSLFQVERMLVKAIPAAVERIAALKAAGFVPAKVAGREHYFIFERDDQSL